VNGSQKMEAHSAVIGRHADRKTHGNALWFISLYTFRRWSLWFSTLQSHVS